MKVVQIAILYVKLISNIGKKNSKRKSMKGDIV